MNRRPRKTRSKWQSLINNQKQSGVSVPEFCQQHDISESSFHKWRLVFSKDGSGFEKLAVNQSSMPGKIRCVLPNGLRLEWDESVSSNTLLQVLRALS